MTNDIFQPLQLSAGTHQPGSGKGCAMNVISWENGDVEITDFPVCSDPYLAVLVQALNDSLADIETGTLSPEDSMMVLELGHMTVGTSAHGLSDEKMVNIYEKLATKPYKGYFLGTLVDTDIQSVIYLIEKSWRVDRNLRTAAIVAGAKMNSRLYAMPVKSRYEFLKRHIQDFQEMTGTTPVETPVEKTQEAVQKMLVRV